MGRAHPPWFVLKRGIQGQLRELELWGAFVRERERIKAEEGDGLSVQEIYQRAYKATMASKAPGVELVTGIEDFVPRSEPAALVAARKQAKAEAAAAAEVEKRAKLEAEVSEGVVSGEAPLPEPGEVGVEEGEVGDEGPVIVLPLRDEERRAMFGGRKATASAGIRWVAAQLAYERPDWDSAPSEEAVAILNWARLSSVNESEFWRIMWVKVLPNRSQTEQEDLARGDEVRMGELLARATKLVHEIRYGREEGVNGNGHESRLQEAFSAVESAGQGGSVAGVDADLGGGDECGTGIDEGG